MRVAVGLGTSIVLLPQCSIVDCVEPAVRLQTPRHHGIRSRLPRGRGHRRARHPRTCPAGPPPYPGDSGEPCGECGHPDYDHIGWDCLRLGYPRTCAGCGRTVKADDGWFETVVKPYVQRSWHWGCRWTRAPHNFTANSHSRPAGPKAGGE